MNSKDSKIALKRRLARLVALSTCLCFYAQAVLAEESHLDLGENIGTAGNVFVSGNYPGAVLMPISLWGAVRRPGIHHIPLRTNLLTLMSYAGGPLTSAELDDVVIKRISDQEEKILSVDIKKILTTKNMRGPELKANDIILVPFEEPAIDPNTVQVVGFVASIFSLIITAFLLERTLSQN